MKTFFIALTLALVLMLQLSLPDQEPAPIKFKELSETSRPIEIKYIIGTDTQTGLIIGLFNYDSLELEIEIKRGTFLKSADEFMQSMLIAKERECTESIFGFTSCRADWMPYKSSPVYLFKLPPQQLTNISLNAVCTELEKNPPSSTSSRFQITQSEHSEQFAKLFAGIDKINNEIVAQIDSAIVERNGHNFTLIRNLTHREQVILSNLTDEMFLNFNTINYAVWAITDHLDKKKMFAKMQEWSGGDAGPYFDTQREMVKIILEEAALPELAKNF